MLWVRSNRNYCTVWELHCYCNYQANAFKRINLKSLLGWIHSVGPNPAMPMGPGVSWDPLGTPVLVVAGKRASQPQEKKGRKRVALSVPVVKGVI